MRNEKYLRYSSFRYNFHTNWCGTTYLVKWGGLLGQFVVKVVVSLATLIAYSLLKCLVL
jgi:hypothetical protein